MLPEDFDVPAESAFLFTLFAYIALFAYTARRIYDEDGYAILMDFALDVAMAIRFERRRFCRCAFVLRWI
jgi:phage anti-repressor protein